MIGCFGLELFQIELGCALYYRMNMLKPNRPIIVALIISAVLNLVLIAYILYLFSYLQRGQHWAALARANLNLAVLNALESGQTNEAVELLEIQLLGDQALVKAQPELTPQTGRILKALNEYPWKASEPQVPAEE